MGDFCGGISGASEEYTLQTYDRLIHEGESREQAIADTAQDCDWDLTALIDILRRTRRILS